MEHAAALDFRAAPAADFAASSTRALGELLEAVSAGTNPARLYRELDAYRHLHKAQAAALSSGDFELQRRFFDELAERRAALEGGPAGVGVLAGGEGAPSEAQVAEFRRHVRRWFELDTELRDMQRLARERRAVKDRLREVITDFMRQYNVEELRTQDGRLRIESRTTRRAPSRAAMRESLEAALADRPELAAHLRDAVFAAPEPVRTEALKRLR